MRVLKTILCIILIMVCVGGFADVIKQVDIKNFTDATLLTDPDYFPNLSEDGLERVCGKIKAAYDKWYLTDTKAFWEGVPHPQNDADKGFRFHLDELNRRYFSKIGLEAGPESLDPLVIDVYPKNLKPEQIYINTTEYSDLWDKLNTEVNRLFYARCKEENKKALTDAYSYIMGEEDNIKNYLKNDLFKTLYENATPELVKTKTIESDIRKLRNNYKNDIKKCKDVIKDCFKDIEKILKKEKFKAEADCETLLKEYDLKYSVLSEHIKNVRWKDIDNSIEVSAGDLTDGQIKDALVNYPLKYNNLQRLDSYKNSAEKISSVIYETEHFSFDTLLDKDGNLDENKRTEQIQKFIKLKSSYKDSVNGIREAFAKQKITLVNYSDRENDIQRLIDSIRAYTPGLENNVIIRPESLTMSDFEKAFAEAKASDRFEMLKNKKEFSETLANFETVQTEAMNFWFADLKTPSEKKEKLEYFIKQRENYLADFEDLKAYLKKNATVLNYVVKTDFIDLVIDEIKKTNFTVEMTGLDKDMLFSQIEDSAVIRNSNEINKIFSESYEKQTQDILNAYKDRKVYLFEKAQLDADIAKAEEFRKNYRDYASKQLDTLKNLLAKHSITIEYKKENLNYAFFDNALNILRSVEIDQGVPPVTVDQLNWIYLKPELDGKGLLSLFSHIEKNALINFVNVYSKLYPKDHDINIDRIKIRPAEEWTAQDLPELKKLKKEYESVIPDAKNARERIEKVLEEKEIKLSVRNEPDSSWITEVTDKIDAALKNIAPEEKEVRIAGYAEFDSTKQGDFDKAVRTAERMAQRHALYAVAGAFVDVEKTVRNTEVDINVTEQAGGFISEFVQTDEPEVISADGNIKMLKVSFLAKVDTGKVLGSDNLAKLYKKAGSPKFYIQAIGTQGDTFSIEKIVGDCLKEKNFAVYPKMDADKIFDLLNTGEIGFVIKIGTTFLETADGASANLTIVPMDPKNEWKMITVKGVGSDNIAALEDAGEKFRSEYFDKFEASVVEYWLQSIKEKTISVKILGVDNDKTADGILKKIKYADPLCINVPKNTISVSKNGMEFKLMTNSDLETFKNAVIAGVRLDKGKVTVEGLDFRNDSIVLKLNR